MAAEPARFSLHKVYYSPGLDIVTFAMQAENGPFKGQIRDFYTSQEKIAQHSGADAWHGSDEQILAEAHALLDEAGAELVIIEPPAPEEIEETPVVTVASQ